MSNLGEMTPHLLSLPNNSTTISWDSLDLKTYSECNPVLQMWAAGFLEGFITASKIKDFHQNLKELNSNGLPCINTFH